MAEFPTFNGSWPWPWIGSYCIPSCISRRPLPTHQISLKSKKRFVDARMDGRTFETHFIRSTQSSRPKNEKCCFKECYGLTTNKINKELQTYYLLTTFLTAKNHSTTCHIKNFAWNGANRLPVVHLKKATKLASLCACVYG